MPTYAYNAPRPAFDNLFDTRADELGVKRARTRAKIERVGTDGLRLTEETLALAPWLQGKQPGSDCGFHRAHPAVRARDGNSRRSRSAQRCGLLRPLCRLRGKYAQWTSYHWSSRQWLVLAHSFAGRLSVGVVMNKDAAAQLGATPEERLEAAISRDPLLAAAGKNRQRLTEVATYTNYQLVSTRGYGPGWAMSGDAFGFVDPMLSPGMHLALHSAELLSENLHNLAAYSREMRKLIRAWMGLIEYFYDGRIFAMYKSGMMFERKFPGKITDALHNFFNGKVACMASGATTASRFGHGMLEIMSRPAGWMTDPETLAIR